MHRDLPGLEKSELLERLNRGHSEGLTVVTPNRRLAQSLARDFAARQVREGRKAWETADILPFEAWLRRLWEDALHAEAAAAMPLLLSPVQEEAAWEEVVRASRFSKDLFAIGPAVAQCREAWQLAHAWRIPLDARRIPNEDARAFLEWSSHYERLVGGRKQADAARLADLLVQLLAQEQVRKPALLAMAGFDIVTPQQREFLERIATHGTRVVEVASVSRKASVARAAVADARAEIDAAASWARSRLEASHGATRIGIVVPDLAQSRSRVERALANVLVPAHALGAEASPLPFNISLGLPLDAHPLVADALLVIDLAGAHAPFEHASRVLRSPFIAGAESEQEARARLDARLRRRSPPEVALEAFLRQCEASGMPPAPDFIDRFRRLSEFRKSGLFEARSASAWARAFSDALRIVGFPGERTLDSGEQQTLDRWHELLAEFATLEQVVGKIGFQLARERLRRMAREAIFQPQAADVPIQVLGILESAGQEFDHLWVMGLTDDAWPLPARPNPFIPVAAQRAAGIAQADPAASLELDRRITQGWMDSAPEVVFSHATMRKESELAPSPLIAALPAQEPDDLGVRSFPSLHEAMRAAPAVETLQDGVAPPVEEGLRRGGTGLFKDQAACPFRAFAKRRLFSDDVETPRTGLDPRDRGTLMHEMLKAIWDRVVTQARLVAMSPAEVDAVLAESAEQALVAMKRRRAETLSGRYGELERERLVRLAGAWLEVERSRAVPFTVLKTEEECEVEFGGVRVKGRLDRRDELDGGRIAVIDYKSGECRTGAWAGNRPDEPQLPMYALGGPDAQRVSVVAFAQIRTGASRFRGLSESPNLLPLVTTVDKDRSRAVKDYGNWERLVTRWRADLDGLGRAFAAGDARVDPKSVVQTCATCEQHALCRVSEKAPFGAASGDEEGEADD
jgi:probable DNA repair protein